MRQKESENVKRGREGVQKEVCPMESIPLLAKLNISNMLRTICASLKVQSAVKKVQSSLKHAQLN